MIAGTISDDVLAMIACDTLSGLSNASISKNVNTSTLIFAQKIMWIRNLVINGIIIEFVNDIPEPVGANTNIMERKEVKIFHTCKERTKESRHMHVVKHCAELLMFV